MNTTEPTSEGLRRYPETQGYNRDCENVDDPDSPGEPCTCTKDCHTRCAGECGCSACSLQFAVFADVAGFYHLPDDGPMDEEGALKAYREWHVSDSSSGPVTGG